MGEDASQERTHLNPVLVEDSGHALILCQDSEEDSGHTSILQERIHLDPMSGENSGHTSIPVKKGYTSILC